MIKAMIIQVMQIFHHPKEAQDSPFPALVLEANPDLGLLVHHLQVVAAVQVVAQVVILTNLRNQVKTQLGASIAMLK